jgi:hypothetical protein
MHTLDKSLSDSDSKIAAATVHFRLGKNLVLYSLVEPWSGKTHLAIP